MNKDADVLTCERCGAAILPVELEGRCVTFDAVLHRAGRPAGSERLTTRLGTYCPDCGWRMRPYARRAKDADIVATCASCGRRIRSGDWCVTVVKRLGFLEEVEEAAELLEVSADEVAVYCAICGARLAMRKKTQQEEEDTEAEYDEDFRTLEFYEREFEAGMALAAAEEWARQQRKRLGLPPDAHIPLPREFVELMVSDFALLMPKDFDFSRYEVVWDGGNLKVVKRRPEGEDDKPQGQ